MNNILVLEQASIITQGYTGPDLEAWRPTYDI